MTEQLTAPMTQTSDAIDATTVTENNSVAVKSQTEKDKKNALLPHPIFAEVNQRCLITAEQLKRYSDADSLPTDTRTAPDLDIGFGQQRALKALHTALDINASGYD